MPVSPITNAEFDSATASGVVAIDFWATWCGPCRMMAPIFESVADDFKNYPVKFLKVDIDSEPMLAARFGIDSIPTLIVLKDGIEFDVRVGVTSPRDLANIITEALK